MSKAEARRDFYAILDGEKIRLFPKKNNQSHKKPFIAVHNSGYFYTEGARQSEGADYHLGDIDIYIDHFEVLP